MAQGLSGQPVDQAIGKVLAVTGVATIEHTGAVVVQASIPPTGDRQGKVGDLVYRGDIVQTGADGKLGLVFADGTTFNISSNARMELNEFVYDPKGSSNSTLLNLKKGAFTFIAGAIAKSGDMKIETPVGTMGIRGTAPHVEVAEDGTVKFSTLVEESKKKRTQTPATRSGSAAGQDRSVILHLEQCNGVNRPSAESQIVACTALIEDQIEKPESLAIAFNNRGIARTSKGDYRLAIEDFDESIKLNSAFAKAFNNRGTAYAKLGNQDRAITDFSAAITLSTGYVNAIANRAQSYEKKRDYVRALSDLDEAIMLEPSLGSLRNERCWVRAITGAGEEALADCNEAIRLGPASAAKFDSRGFALLKLGRWQSAIADFDAALRLNPRLPGSLYGRGFAHLKLGNVAAGRADTEAAVRAKRNIAEEYAGYGLR
jgi:lipoprotein NlpI